MTSHQVLPEWCQKIFRPNATSELTKMSFSSGPFALKKATPLKRFFRRSVGNGKMWCPHKKAVVSNFEFVFRHQNPQSNQPTYKNDRQFKPMCDDDDDTCFALTC